MTITQLELTEELVNAAGPYKKFGQFNRVQSTLLQGRIPDQDCNLILATATSTGKTVSAEFFVFTTLAQKKKVIYVAPMKALAQEKYADWTRTFPNFRVEIITGDHKTNASDPRFEEAHIIILTSEMLDSKTRGLRNQEHWLRQSGLLIMDESHIMGVESRGGAAEAGIIRLSRYVPKARLVLLSATLPNYEDFGRWLHKLNGKDTYIINSSWRPIPLHWHYVELKAKNGYQGRIDETVRLAVQIAREQDPHKCLCFVHEKKTGAALQSSLATFGIEARFHSADLSLKERTEIENSFARREGGLRVLISTSTLAWGISLPARNVIICGTQRGMADVDIADIVQAAGRSGRAGLDEVGNCHLICSNPRSMKAQIEKQPPVTSKLLDPIVLRFQVITEVAMQTVRHTDDLTNWFHQTLASQQWDYPDAKFNECVAKLAKWGMLICDDEGNLSVTETGKICVKFYFTPDDVHHWSRTMHYTTEMDDKHLAILIGAVPSAQLGYVPYQFQGNVTTFGKLLTNSGVSPDIIPNNDRLFSAWVMYEHLQGEAADKGLSFYLRQFINDSERILSALTHLSKLRGIQFDYSSLDARLKYGVPKELVWLCEYPNIGPKKAGLMWMNGITSPDVLRQMDVVKLGSIVGKATAVKLINHLKG